MSDKKGLSRNKYHLYSIVFSGNFDCIMETFPIVKRKDIQKYGDYRTKLTILKIYDEMKKAMETGKLYKTILDPPPADPRVAHQKRLGSDDEKWTFKQ